MIAKKDYITIIKFLYKNNNGYTKYQLKEILKDLKLTTKEFDKIIKTLKDLKVLVKDKHKMYYLNRRFDYVEGTYVITKNKKFVSGYDLNDQKIQLDVSDVNNNDAFYKDKVLAIRFGKNECKIIHKFEHFNTKLTGIYMDSNTFGFVLLDNKNFNKDIHISLENKNGAMQFDKVEVEILPEIIGKNPEGKITKIYTDTFKDNVLSLEDILTRNRIEKKHSIKAINQIKKMVSYEKDNLSFELNKRKDLTNEVIFTIDGIDSKDLDDAISIKILPNNNYLLGVHIADVSHYVTEGSKIDEEALDRGTSIYLINTVIPMLPPILSNDLCSLNPNQIRLTLSCEMEIDKNGKVVNSSIFESYIKSRAKLNYPQVTAFFENTDNGEFEKEYPDIAQSLLIMKDLMNILYNKRLNRGCIEFESEESKIELNKDGKPISIKKYEKGISNDLIEEFMLVCNETIAKTYFDKQLPFIFRVHEFPREEKFEQLQKFIGKYGYKIDVDYEHLSSKDFQKLLNSIKNKKEYLPISLMTLRTMQQARYKEFQNKHFGLGADYYTHFTSPIRRYPDLMIHRIIKEDLRGNISEYRKKDLEDIVRYVAKECSKKERIADNIEEEYDNLKKAEYLENNINTFQGIITNLNQDEIEITLDNTIVGKIKYNKQKFIFKEDEYVIKDKLTNEIIYELGQILNVKVKKVDLMNTFIYFEIVETIEE